MLRRRYKWGMAWITILFMLLPLTLKILYQMNQEKLILESNQLHSSTFFYFSPKENPDWKGTISSKNDTFWVMGQEDIDKISIMGIYTNHSQSLPLPIKKGRNFLTENSQEALVGKNVPYTIEGKNRYFQYQNKKYKIIGELGIQSKSALDKVALVNDTSLLDKEEELSINGKNSELLNLIGTRKGDSKGVERLLNISWYSYLLDMTVYLTLFLCSFLWAYFFYQSQKKKYQVLHLLGTSKYSILSKDIALLVLLLLSSMLPYLFVNLIIPPYLFRKLIVHNFLVLAIILSFFILIFNLVEIGGKKR